MIEEDDERKKWEIYKYLYIASYMHLKCIPVDQDFIKGQGSIQILAERSQAKSTKCIYIY